MSNRPVPPLTPKMMHLAADLLDKAGQKFGNHCCNDYTLPNWLTDDDAVELDLAEHTWNGDPEEHDPRPSRYATDFSLMCFLAAMLRGAAGPLPKIDAAAVARRTADEELRHAEEEVKRAAATRIRVAADEAAAEARLKAARERLK